MMHHAGKPKQTNGQTPDQLDLQYLGYGTSEIQNSFRAVNILRKLPTPPNCYQLDFAKRGDRCGARDLDGHSTQTIFLEHSNGGIFWLQRGAPTGPKSKYTHDQILCHMDEEKPITVSELLKLAVHPDHAHMSRATFFRLWDEIIEEKKAVKSGPEGWVLPPPKSHWSHEVS
jgi:hypothetical protein